MKSLIKRNLLLKKYGINSHIFLFINNIKTLTMKSLSKKIKESYDSDKKYTSYEQIKKDYPYTKENPNKAHDVFTKYVMDRISLKQRQEIRKNWDGKGLWQDHLLKKVNEIVK